MRGPGNDEPDVGRPGILGSHFGHAAATADRVCGIPAHVSERVPRPRDGGGGNGGTEGSDRQHCHAERKLAERSEVAGTQMK